jgi:decaprenyl-phosphate phosphoribosyltransferase
LRACRPRQWAKNLLLLAAPSAAGVIGEGHVLVRVGGAFVAFCMLASATYLLNDVRDRDQDRRHPRKRTRPVAAGEISPAAALALAGGLAVAGIGLAAAVRPELAAVACGYLALTITYSLWWRRIVVADILAIAAGFVLRAIAGGVAADVPLSRWFMAVTSLCAIFVVAGKRHAELQASGLGAHTRATLGRYSATSLRIVLTGAALLGVVAYGIWAFTPRDDGGWYELSIVPFVMWLARYGVLLARGAGQSPEEVILQDRTLLVLSGAWVALFLGSVYVAS